MSALDLLSDWSSFTRIFTSGKQWQEGNTGRYYYRHPTEPGTVIGWVWTSTEASSRRLRIVGYDGACDKIHKSNARVALPVLELHLL